MDRYIIGGNSTGKTRKLLEIAKESGAIVVCENPSAMLSKAHAYGIVGLHYIGYEQYMSCVSVDNDLFVVDEIGKLMNYWTHGRLHGFTMTVDEE